MTEIDIKIKEITDRYARIEAERNEACAALKSYANPANYYHRNGFSVTVHSEILYNQAVAERALRAIEGEHFSLDSIIVRRD